ncbi:MAG: ATP-binding protein [Planctomycetes bacterium]|nr:ATP-binding protein [Planctomycetota bacterium]
MAFVSGPRQVGKTTVCEEFADPGAYLNWDRDRDRNVLRRGQESVAQHVGLDRSRTKPAVVVLDEVHRYGRWKHLLKGLYDAHKRDARFIVTGSSRLDVFQRGGDSLMGRYFLYRMHPLGVAELVHPTVPEQPIRPPGRIADADWTALLEHGGFPEPFLRRTAAFTRRWRSLRMVQLVREDLRDLTRVQELERIEMLALLLLERSGGQLSFASLANDLHVSPDTAKRWVRLLANLHHGFLVRPWFKNVARSLRKEPRWYSLDWTAVDDEGRRAETLVAAHLKKAVDGWTDLGLGAFDLFYLRDKDGHEVDFVVVKDKRPWFLVEVKLGEDRLAADVHRFHEVLGTQHAFQVVLGLPYEDVDVFADDRPRVVPARTLLSQLY